MMDELSEIVMLLDFYGGLLTEKQKEILSMHYEEDMSLGEISENLDISRQAVHDLIKRSLKIIKDYESTLGLIKRYLDNKKALEEIKILLNSRKDNDITAAINKIDELLEV